MRLAARILIGEICLAREEKRHASPAEKRKSPLEPASSPHGFRSLSHTHIPGSHAGADAVVGVCQERRTWNDGSAGAILLALAINVKVRTCRCWWEPGCGQERDLDILGLLGSRVSRECPSKASINRPICRRWARL